MYTTLALSFILLACVSAQQGFVPRLDGRIVGGENTNIEKYPHQISLRYMGAHRCGGSIVSENVIVTAAHCVDGIMLPSLLKIRAGVSYKSVPGTDISVKKIHVHEKYDSSKTNNDIAILILAKPLTFNSKIQPIEMAEFNEEIAEGTSAFVTGWGTTTQGGLASACLKSVSVDVIGFEKCSTAYKDNRITETMICAGKVDGGKDACQGDSGGPMIVYDKDNKMKLVGIVSWGYGCARPEYPGVYAKVSALRNWIKEKINF